MTCIVGIEHAGGVTIGADSAASDGWSFSARADGKLFRNGPYLIGFCGSYRMGQLLRYSLEAPIVPERDLDRHMATTFINAVRSCLLDGGYAERKNRVETGGTFLVGVAGRLFMIESDYQVGGQRNGFDACGSGAEVALGSLHTTANAKSKMAPRRRALTALQAAADLTAFVGGPFQVRTLRAA